MRILIQDLKRQSQAYIRAVFAETLRKEGFVSYKNEDICWFRFPTDDIIQSVLFTTTWKEAPIFLDIYYGSYPWFSDLGIPNNVHAYGGEAGNSLMERAFLSPEKIFDRENDIYVSCPRDKQFGLQILTDEILPYFQESSDLKSSYEQHKKSYLTRREICERELKLKGIEDNRPTTPGFDLMHEIVYNNDFSMYPGCTLLVERCMTWGPKPEVAEYCVAFNEVLAGNRKPYLDLLAKKKELMIKKLKRGGLI